MAELGDEAPLTINVLADTDGPVVKLVGELDLSNVDTLRAAVESILAEPPGHLAFELSDLSFLDTSGIAFLLRTNAAVGPIKLVRPSHVVRRIIETTGLADVLTMEP
jgi:anti-anti-sigma factor